MGSRTPTVGVEFIGGETRGPAAAEPEQDPALLVGTTLTSLLERQEEVNATRILYISIVGN